MEGYEISGTYGSHKIATRIYCYKGWYVCHGDTIVNRADEESLVENVNIKELKDYDSFTWSKPIQNLQELIHAVKF